ncbi:hypothetical protein LIPSTDRAFT_151752 [Lipomyces starkeyi NRRL Y-11557]|uniref:Uncharacterized protein n=1 Tax=Lipomyces starkeyi NRRL Y-11557 TaxID=675824 RepID=A0A1E3Q0V0_LIPST|nr:hypothetical protein LIPSTDRAFT_151752 [Lipomyces starkeyi NRRL Y-11557]
MNTSSLTRGAYYCKVELSKVRKFLEQFGFKCTNGCNSVSLFRRIEVLVGPLSGGTRKASACLSTGSRQIGIAKPRYLYEYLAI